MYELTLKTGFAAAHRLRGYEGKCESLHGHNWNVEVKVAGREVDSTGLLMDFKELRALVAEVVEEFDHTYLNDLAPFERANPTTELISRHIADRLSGVLPEGVVVRAVTCWESDKCGASYIPAQSR